MKKFSHKVLACLLSAGMVVSLGGVSAPAAEPDDIQAVSEEESAEVCNADVPETYAADDYIEVTMDGDPYQLSYSKIDAAIDDASEQTFTITNQMTGDEKVTAQFVLITDLLKNCLTIDGVKEITINDAYTSGWEYNTIYGEKASYTIENAWLYRTDEGYGFASDEGNWVLWDENPVKTIAASSTTTDDPGTTDPDSEDPDPDGLISIGVTSYEAWTTIDTNVVVDPEADFTNQRMHFEFSFDEALTCTSIDALTEELKNAGFMMADAVIWGNSETGGRIENVSLNDGGKTLYFEVFGYYAPFNGKFVANTILESLSTAEGKHAKLYLKFFVPNGLMTSTEKQVVGSTNENASVTTKFLSDENTSRAMIHLTVLLNGVPVNPNDNGATAEGHWHDYQVLTTEEFVDWYYETLQNGLGDDWQVTANGDEMTVTYLSSSPGDVVDLHITSYLNTNYAGLDTSALETVMEQAKALLDREDERENVKVLQDAYTCASVRLNHRENYSQAEMNEMVTILETAIDNYHSWNDGEITKIATIGEDGEILYTCTICGDTKIEYYSVDTSALDALIAEAEKLNEEDYTEATWSEFAAALKEAKEIVANPSSRQAAVDAALSALQSAMNGLKEKTRDIVKINGVWTYTIEGVPDYTYTGFGTNKYGEWYVEKGIVTFNKTDIIKDTTAALGKTGAWYYVIDSKVQTDFTGLSNFKNSNGWWYIVKGEVDFTHNGVDKNKNGWFYVTDGKVQFGFTGLANYKNSNGWWYIKKGAVDFTHNGVDKNKNGWWYVTGGKVQFGFTGLANYKNSNGWWYIKNGAVDFDHNGVNKNKNGWFYVTGGKVQFGFTGLANYANSSGWWYIKKGAVDFTFRGIAENKNGTWYLDGGKVQFGFNGSVKAGGRTYTVRNGKVV